MRPEIYIGILRIFLDRKEACIRWGKDSEELRTDKDRCFNVSGPDITAEWKLNTLLNKAVIQYVKLKDNTIIIYLIAVF